MARARLYFNYNRKPFDAIHGYCVALSTELLQGLETLKVPDGHKHRRWKSFRQALKSVWSNRDIDVVANRLQLHQKELDAHVLVSLR